MPKGVIFQHLLFFSLQYCHIFNFALLWALTWKDSDVSTATVSLPILLIKLRQNRVIAPYILNKSFSEVFVKLSARMVRFSSSVVNIFTSLVFRALFRENLWVFTAKMQPSVSIECVGGWCSQVFSRIDYLNISQNSKQCMDAGVHF